jgi:hypothetical protein
MGKIPFLCGAIVLGQFGFFTRGLIIGIALFLILNPPVFVLLLPADIDPIFESRLNTDIPARAPIDTLLLPLRPIISVMVRFGIIYYGFLPSFQW